MKKKNISRKLITVVGPTASGKTSLGVFLAKKFNGEIISADSRQVYKGLDIGTGKDISEYDGIKYHLIDVCRPGGKFTLFDWLKLARETIEDIFGRDKLPLIVGGTGLYIQALLEGFQLKPDNSQFTIYNFQSNTKSQIPKYQREELNKMPLSKLQKIASDYLPNKANKAKRLDLQNPHRLIRFIEKAQAGVVPSKQKPDFGVLQIGINLSKEELYKKINQRVDQRFKQGMLEEVQALIDAGVDPKWLLSLGLEYRIITKYILEKSQITNYKSSASGCLRRDGQINSNIKIQNHKKLEAESYKLFSDMKQELKHKSHQYARRQLTWFGRFVEIKWIKNQKEAELLVKNYL